MLKAIWPQLRPRKIAVWGQRGASFPPIRMPKCFMSLHFVCPVVFTYDLLFLVGCSVFGCCCTCVWHWTWLPVHPHPNKNIIYDIGSFRGNLVPTHGGWQNNVVLAKPLQTCCKLSGNTSTENCSWKLRPRKIGNVRVMTVMWYLLGYMCSRRPGPSQNYVSIEWHSHWRSSRLSCSAPDI